MIDLKRLRPNGNYLVDQEFCRGGLAPDLVAYEESAGINRPVALDLATKVVTEAMKDPQYVARPSRGRSDAWLAPRLHAALRLTRQEAADAGLWAYLAVSYFADYVRWRFPGTDPNVTETARKRFVGQDRDNALSRLWWAAELFRNGGDYGPVAAAFAKQDIANTWLSLNAVHHRPLALGAVRLLSELNRYGINGLSRVFNHHLTTLLIDAAAPADVPDGLAQQEWVATEPDYDLLLNSELPKGPDEDAVPEETIKVVEQILRLVHEREKDRIYTSHQPPSSAGSPEDEVGQLV